MERKSFRSKSIALIGSALLMLIAFAPVSVVISAPIVVPFDETQLNGIVKDKDWLLVLGRAFFWDQQMGSDGGSCASCHFSAGTDTRLTGQMNPAFRAGGAPDTVFGCTEGERCVTGTETGSGGTAGPEYTFVRADYPFRQLEDVNDRNSKILINSNDVHSSAGSFDAKFKKAFHGKEFCGKPNKDIFYKTAKYGHHKSFRIAARAVEPRNTATTINAAMSHTLAWDGRANNIFNGVGVFGLSEIIHEPTRRLIKMDGDYASLTHIEITNSAMASFSVGPILDNLEMSCDGRTFADVARKILYTRPLRKQRIAETDSTFGYHGPKGDIRAKRKGLKGKYKYYKLIQLAFDEKWWKGKGLWKIVEEDGEGVLKKTKSYKHGHTQMEINFPMFWGLALQRYQHTLISSNTSKFDMAEAKGCFDQTGVIPNPGGPPTPVFGNLQACIDEGPHVWTEEEELGRTTFNGFGPGNGGCAACHGGNMFTNAAFTEDGHFDAMVLLNFGGPIQWVDEGFQNTGANLLAQDLGRFATDPWGVPLSYTMQLATGNIVDPKADVCNAAILGPPNATPAPGPLCDVNGVPRIPVNWATQSVEVGGSMKSPTMRNVGLTPPYFHYGGYSDLRDIMDFYNRGGSERDIPNNPPGCTVGDDIDFAAGEFPCSNTSGSGPFGQTPFGETHPSGIIGSNAAGAITPLGLSDEKLDAMVAYLLTLSDPHVMCDAGAFDHPELIIFAKAKGKDRNWDYRADDVKVRLPAVGIEGYGPARPELCIPNKGDLFAPGMGERVGDKNRSAL